MFDWRKFGGVDAEANPGLTVRNTFIDVYQPAECPISHSAVSSPNSPHRRNLSAPPSPTKRYNLREEELGFFARGDIPGNDTPSEDSVGRQLPQWIYEDEIPQGEGKRLSLDGQASFSGTPSTCFAFDSGQGVPASGADLVHSHNLEFNAGATFSGGRVIDHGLSKQFAPDTWPDLEHDQAPTDLQCVSGTFTSGASQSRPSLNDPISSESPAYIVSGLVAPSLLSSQSPFAPTWATSSRPSTKGATRTREGHSSVLGEIGGLQAQLLEFPGRDAFTPPQCLLDSPELHSSPLGYFPRFNSSSQSRLFGQGSKNLGSGIPSHASQSGKPSHMPRHRVNGNNRSTEKGRGALNGGGPKRTDYLQKYGGTRDDHDKPVTTMMLRNIPCRKLQDEVKQHIDQKGFAGKYNFLYLPRDVKFHANLGYAFINFINTADARCFEREMNGYRFTGSGSSKACEVVPAHVQGLLNNIAAFKRTEVMRSNRKPYFLSGDGL